MADQIYIVDPKTKESLKVNPVSFSDIGISERDDLEQWLINHPEMLGEPLLVITSEFGKFDKSGRRLDLMALDKKGMLVIVELKLDIRRSLADLQAIRYAAFCSTMEMDEVVKELAQFEDLNTEEATEKICTFLDTNELPELDSQPRVILAAGIIDDQELTSSVLWLRKCGVEISCIELTPYHMPDSQKIEIVIVPKVIIPIPEARDYLVKVEQKEARQAQKARDTTELEKIGYAIAKEFEKLNTGFELSSGRMRSRYMQVRLHHSWIHYEWLLSTRDSQLKVALHFESSDRDENMRLVGLIKAHEKEIAEGVNRDFKAGPWGRKTTSAEFYLPYEGNIPGTDIAIEAADTMRILIERTWPLIKEYVKGDNTS